MARKLLQAIVFFILWKYRINASRTESYEYSHLINMLDYIHFARDLLENIW